MPDNKLKFMLGIIATTSILALSSATNAESGKPSAVSNILKRANLNIALSQSEEPRPGILPFDPGLGNSKQAIPVVGSRPSKATSPGQGVPGKFKPGRGQNADDWCIFCNQGCGKKPSGQLNKK